MSNFNISPNNPAFILLKKFLIMDPNKRITTTEAIQDSYMSDNPCPVRDAFTCFKSKIPFPMRQFLPKKVPTTEPNIPNVAGKYINATNAISAITSQMQFIPKPDNITRRNANVSERNFIRY